LNAAERNYPVHEQEQLAILHALRTFRPYIDARHVIVYTDHAALVHMHTQPQLSKRQIRWQAELANYDFEVRYHPGKDNVAADALSRRPDHQLAALTTMLPDTSLLDAIKYAYISDPFFHDPAALSDAYQKLDDLWYHTNLDSHRRLCIPSDPSVQSKL
jgi:hypothetical protein